MSRAGTEAFRCGFRQCAVNAASAGDQAGDRFTVSGNHNFFTLFHAVQ
jgi:hypothetical protein